MRPVKEEPNHGQSQQWRERIRTQTLAPLRSVGSAMRTNHDRGGRGWLEVIKHVDCPYFGENRVLFWMNLGFVR